MSPEQMVSEAIEAKALDILDDPGFTARCGDYLEACYALNDTLGARRAWRALMGHEDARRELAREWATDYYSEVRE